MPSIFPKSTVFALALLASAVPQPALAQNTYGAAEHQQAIDALGRCNKAGRDAQGSAVADRAPLYAEVTSVCEASIAEIAQLRADHPGMSPSVRELTAMFLASSHFMILTSGYWATHGASVDAPACVHGREGDALMATVTLEPGSKLEQTARPSWDLAKKLMAKCPAA